MSKLVIGTLVNLKVMVKANERAVVLYHKGRGYKSIFKKIEEELIEYQPKKVYFILFFKYYFLIYISNFIIIFIIR